MISPAFSLYFSKDYEYLIILKNSEAVSILLGLMCTKIFLVILFFCGFHNV